MIAFISFFFFSSSFYSRRVSDVLLSLVYFYLFGFLIKFFLCVLLTLCKCLEKNIKLWSHLIGDVSMTMAMTANTNAETPAVYIFWHQAHRSHGDWSVLLLLILLLLLFISLSLEKANQRNIIWSGTGGPRGERGNSHVSDVTNGKSNIYGGNQFSKIDNRHLRRLLHWLLDHHMTMNVTARFRFGTRKILRIHFHTRKNSEHLVNFYGIWILAHVAFSMNYASFCVYSLYKILRWLWLWLHTFPPECLSAVAVVVPFWVLFFSHIHAVSIDACQL